MREIIETIEHLQPEGSRANCEGIDKKMMQDEKRLKILFLPACYLSGLNPIGGLSEQEHAKAASTSGGGS